jgi:hypothetical protein
VAAWTLRLPMTIEASAIYYTCIVLNDPSRHGPNFKLTLPWRYSTRVTSRGVTLAQLPPSAITTTFAGP